MITTKTGDDGYTDINGTRIAKFDPIVELLGEVDEAVASIVVSIAHMHFYREIPDILKNTIDDLHDIMSTISGYQKVSGAKLDKHVAQMEETIYAQVIEDFTYPTDDVSRALLNVARTVVRRVERHFLSYTNLVRVEEEDSIAVYLNRLSDYLFALSVEDETKWKK